MVARSSPPQARDWASAKALLDEFERSAKQAIAALDRDPEGCAAAGAASDRWVGELLPDDPYESWLEVPRDRLRQLHQELLRRSRRWGELALADPADEEANLGCRGQQLAAATEEPRYAS